MLSYDKFAGSDDEDESDMEADFASIQREERRRYTFSPISHMKTFFFCLSCLSEILEI